MDELARTTEGTARDLALVRGPSEGTTRAYRAYVRGFVDAGLPHTAEGLAAWVDGMRGRRPANSVNLALAAGKAAFLQAAGREGATARDLALIRGALAEIKGERRAPPDVAVVTPEERRLLFRALPPRVRLVAETLYRPGPGRGDHGAAAPTGWRSTAGSCCGCTDGPEGAAGNDHPRAVPADRGGFGDGGEHLFTTSRGNPYRGTYITREIDRAARRVLGRHVTAHVLRHSRATDLLATTHRIKAVSRLLGHADEAVTLRYYVRDAFTDEELAAGVDEPAEGGTAEG